MTYEAIKCVCGDSACTQWQVKGLAGEAKFSEKQSKAVAALLNKINNYPTWNCYCVNLALEVKP